MTHYILLIISTALINNFVLVKFLGLCPFMGVSKKIETAIGMGLATTFVLTVASLCSYLVDNYILMPLNATFLRTLVFILVIAVVVQLGTQFNRIRHLWVWCLFRFCAGFSFICRIA